MYIEYDEFAPTHPGNKLFAYLIKEETHTESYKDLTEEQTYCFLIRPETYELLKMHDKLDSLNDIQCQVINKNYCNWRTVSNSIQIVDPFYSSFPVCDEDIKYLDEIVQSLMTYQKWIFTPRRKLSIIISTYGPRMPKRILSKVIEYIIDCEDSKKHRVRIMLDNKINQLLKEVSF